MEVSEIGAIAECSRQRIEMLTKSSPAATHPRASVWGLIRPSRSARFYDGSLEDLFHTRKTLTIFVQLLYLLNGAFVSFQF